MSGGRMVELAVAVVLLGAGLFFYRRRDKGDSYGPQGAVIMFVVAAIMGAHALGAFDYHPTRAEAEYMRDHGQ